MYEPVAYYPPDEGIILCPDCAAARAATVRPLAVKVWPFMGGPLDVEAGTTAADFSELAARLDGDDLELPGRLAELAAGDDSAALEAELEACPGARIVKVGADAILSGWHAALDGQGNEAYGAPPTCDACLSEWVSWNCGGRVGPEPADPAIEGFQILCGWPGEGYTPANCECEACEKARDLLGLRLRYDSTGRNWEPVADLAPVSARFARALEIGASLAATEDRPSEVAARAAFEAGEPEALALADEIEALRSFEGPSIMERARWIAGVPP